MGGASALVTFSAGVVLGVFISQQYAVPDLSQGVTWIGEQAKELEKMYKKNKPGGDDR